MKKIEKQPPVKPERSETPVSQVHYVLWYERHSSYRRTTEKNLKQSPVSPVTPVTPVLQVSYASGMNGISHPAGRLKK
jgi:hypothetical protein